MKIALILLICYLLGSIPFGLVWVKLFTGKDIRLIASGRTGGTNAMRAGGPVIGLLTGLGDIFKGFSTYFVMQAFGVTDPWMRVGGALVAILGHNYSVFLLERTEEGKLHLRGGAGGATAFGGALADRLLCHRLCFIDHHEHRFAGNHCLFGARAGECPRR
jgi:glycerol-3-phosphate acyltransferase PlsY